MLTKRIIPCLDVKGGRVVKGVQFLELRDAGDPVEIAELYDSQGADELTFLDITASSDERDIIIDVVRRTAERVFMPLTVGGGVRTVEDIRRLSTPEPTRSQSIPQQCSGRNSSGRQRRDSAPSVPWWLSMPAGVPGEDRWEVYTHGGRKPTGIDAVEWARRMEELGAGEILLTSMDRDGTKDGYDIAVDPGRGRCRLIPVIASGGRRDSGASLRRLHRCWRQRVPGRIDLPLPGTYHCRGQRVSKRPWCAGQALACSLPGEDFIYERHAR